MEAIVAKQHRARGRISSSNKEEDESHTRDNINLD